MSANVINCEMLKCFFLIFPENRLLRFMQIVSKICMKYQLFFVGVGVGRGWGGGLGGGVGAGGGSEGK